MTRQRWTLTLAAFVLLAGSAAQAAPLEGSCTINFYGKSTLHDFEGQAHCVPFTLTGADAAGHQVIHRPDISVPVAGMDTANASRDKKMRAMFDSEHFPLISGLFADIEPEALLKQLDPQRGGATGLPLELRIRDVTRHIEAQASQLVTDAERIAFVVEFPVSLSSFDLKPPSVLGMIKVADEVRVVAHVTLKRRPAGTE